MIYNIYIYCKVVLFCRIMYKERDKGKNNLRKRDNMNFNFNFSVQFFPP